MKEHRSYVTILSSDDFVVGVIMLHLSLKSVKSRYQLFVLCSDCISNKSLLLLDKYDILYKQLSEHINIDKKKINIADGYDHWNHTFDKLYIWTLTEFNKVVYLDSDMQVIRNIDYLFDYPHMSAVIADKWNEPGLDKLNSGLMVIVPNVEEFNGMKSLWESGLIKLKNVGDQDIIRQYYNEWSVNFNLRLQPGLNVFYSEISAGIIKKENVSPVRVIHYIGSRKPWMISIFANIRRMKGNFLWRYLLIYLFRLYTQFPDRIFMRYSIKI